MKIEIDKYGKKHMCVTGSDISDQIEFEEKTQGSETQEITFVDLAEIVDVQAIQFLMDDLYKLVHMPIGLNDLKGKVLAGAGWQDICTNFHWVHPEACKHCIGSGTKLSEDVLQGETKLYKCKNNMWDITAPIMVDNLHVGDIFSGQFFFDDDILDYEHFRSLARKYGFDEEKYIRAFEKVPRLSRAAVETGDRKSVV